MEQHNQRYGVEKLKKNVTLFVSVMMAFVLLSMAGSAHATITSHNWIGTVLKSQTDDFLGYVSAGYATGSTATLKVNVYDHLSRQMNISAVIVRFDWGTNYSSTEVSNTSVYAIATGMSHVFTVTFTIPDTTVASNLVKHTYRIFVEDVNATTGAKKKLNSNSPMDGSDFAVLSEAQANAIETSRELSKYSSYTFMTIKAREMYLMAGGEESLGDKEYQRGNFDNAVTHYQAALSLCQNAWSNETDSVSDFEKALKDLMTTGSSALNMIGWGYVIFGLGWVLIGIGVIIYAIRKPKVTPPP
jgi:hypothetical protein